MRNEQREVKRKIIHALESRNIDIHSLFFSSFSVMPYFNGLLIEQLQSENTNTKSQFHSKWLIQFLGNKKYNWQRVAWKRRKDPMIMITKVAGVQSSYPKSNRDLSAKTRLNIRISIYFISFSLQNWKYGVSNRHSFASAFHLSSFSHHFYKRESWQRDRKSPQSDIKPKITRETVPVWQAYRKQTIYTTYQQRMVEDTFWNSIDNSSIKYKQIY